jgi:ubiquitin C-terminal hydrolase
MGGLMGGHYHAYCKNPENNSWYYFDDRSVSPINIDNIKTANAYVLYYKRRT